VNTPPATLPVHEIAVENLRSLAWWGDDLVDWLGGQRVTLAGEAQRFGVGSTYRFDAAVGSGELGVTFETLGTKGRIARWNGVLPTPGWIPLGVDELRELDRSYYHADAYTFPVCVFTLPDGRAAIAHCPRRYDRLDIELPDGTLLTPRDGKHDDCFHSRLEASVDGRWLLCNGWVWHPANVAHVFDVARALDEPAYLSTRGIALGWYGELYDADEDGIHAATLSGDRVICATGAHLAVFALPSGEPVYMHRVAEPPGTQLMAWGPDHVVAFDGHPRVIELATGAIVHRWDDLDGGPGVHQPSVAMKPPVPPWIARDPANRRFAMGWSERIVVVTGGPPVDSTGRSR
jgi:hypothetical protein